MWISKSVRDFRICVGTLCFGRSLLLRGHDFCPIQNPSVWGGSLSFFGKFSQKKKIAKAKKLAGFFILIGIILILQNILSFKVYQRVSVLLDRYILVYVLSKRSQDGYTLIEASLGLGQEWRNLRREGKHVWPPSIWNIDASFFFSL